MFVQDILRTKGKAVHTVATGARVGDAVDLLNKHNIGAVVVVDDGGAIAGLLSERDVVRKLASHPATVLDRPVADCMTANVITVTPDTEITTVMETMTRHRIRHLPVVDGKALIGIISIGDVVKRKIEEAEQEALHLREYIASGVA